MRPEEHQRGEDHLRHRAERRVRTAERAEFAERRAFDVAQAGPPARRRRRCRAHSPRRRRPGTAAPTARASTYSRANTSAERSARGRLDHPAAHPHGSTASGCTACSSWWRAKRKRTRWRTTFTNRLLRPTNISASKGERGDLDRLRSPPAAKPVVVITETVWKTGVPDTAGPLHRPGRGTARPPARPTPPRARQEQAQFLVAESGPKLTQHGEPDSCSRFTPATTISAHSTHLV
ncbi:hypothetical protein TPAU25S_00904 [Tsukamurella paurometabola]